MQRPFDSSGVLVRSCRCEHTHPSHVWLRGEGPDVCACAIGLLGGGRGVWQSLWSKCETSVLGSHTRCCCLPYFQWLSGLA